MLMIMCLIINLFYQTCLTKQFRNFLKNNNKNARNKNFVDYKNVQKNEQPNKNDSSEKHNFGKEKVGQTSSSSLGQQCFGCQGYGHIKSECPTNLRFKGKTMAVTLSGNGGSDHDFDSDQEGKFMAFTATVVEDESIDERGESPLDENSLKILTCKKLAICYVRLQQKVP